MTKKDQILKAMRIILMEYTERIHEANIDLCQLCVLFFTAEDKYMKEKNYHTCHKCPMFVFHKNDDEYSCMERKCKPINCREGQRPTKGLEKATEFYERVIAVVENMTNDEVCKPRTWKFLVEIDNEVYEKYKVVKKVS